MTKNNPEYWYWKNVFNEKEITDLNFFIDKNFDFMEDKKFIATGKNKNKKKSTVKVIKYAKIKSFLSHLIDECYLTNEQYFGYNLNKIRLNSTCNLNVYSFENKGKYDWHIDESNSNFFDIKFTILINLSTQKYEGGDFLIFNQEKLSVNELKSPGDVIMFRSYLNHKVTPVLKGERRTLAIFLCGPKFK